LDRLMSRSVSNLGSCLGTAIGGTILVAGLTSSPERAYGLALVTLAAIGLPTMWGQFVRTRRARGACTALQVHGSRRR